MRQKRLLGVARIGGKHVTREELQSAIQDFWDETFNHSVHPEISAESKMIAFQCMIDAAKQELPLTLEEVKEHITKGHPNDIKPLYVDFKPTIPIDYTSRWRDAYNLSRLIAGRGDEYGKTWIAYRSKPKRSE